MMSVIFRIIYISFFATILLQSCGGLDDNDFIDSDELSDLDDAEISQFLTDNNITAEKDANTGIYFTKDVENPDGVEASGKICSIYYTASLLDGSVFDEHLEADGDGILLRQGVNAILPFGLEFGLGLMSQGETYTFYIPSQRAYGAFAFSTIIPANSIIKMEVTLDAVIGELELLERESQTIDDFIEDNELNDLDKNPLEAVQTLGSGVRFKRLVEGAGESLPERSQQVSIAYKGTFLDGKVFDETVGDAVFRYTFDNNAVIPGFDEGVGQLRQGDKGLIIIPSNSAYAQSVRVIPAFFKSEFISNNIIPGYVDSIDPYTILLFEIELKEIQ